MNPLKSQIICVFLIDFNFKFRDFECYVVAPAQLAHSCVRLLNMLEWGEQVPIEQVIVDKFQHFAERNNRFQQGLTGLKLVLTRAD